MASYVEDPTGDIEHATHFCDVRDLLQLWKQQARGGIPELNGMLAAMTTQERDRVLVLTDQNGKLLYTMVGQAVVSLIGHNPNGKFLDTLENPGVLPFRERYKRTIQSAEPLFSIQYQIGSDAMGTNERLLMPVRTGPVKQLMVYLRAREDTADVLRAVFNASADSISVLEAIRGPEGQVVDFVIYAVNAETARRMNTQPAALVGRILTEVFPFAVANGFLARFIQSVETQEPEIFDVQYEQGGRFVERELRLAPSGSSLTVTNVDISAVRAATRALEMQRNELSAANALLQRQAVDLKSSNEALEGRTQELRDEIERNKVLAADLIRTARHDGLTGLVNRGRFEMLFDDALKAAKKKKQQVALCVFGLDHFREINDGFGHTGGDAVLREVARRLSSVKRESDVVSRVGGDEFAVLLKDVADPVAAVTMVEGMIAAVMQPFALRRKEVSISVSAGAAIYPTDAISARELMAAADIAADVAKRRGRGKAVFFTADMRDQIEKQRRLIQRLGRALEHGEIVPYYQPLMDLRTGQLVGFEALARWNHPEKGLLGPASFIDALEEPALARALTTSMLHQVIADLKLWSGAGVPSHVSVNVTAFDLRQPDFARDTGRLLAAAGIDSHQLAIEVTETTVLSRDAERIGQTLGELRKLGFTIALDDFGTGYASLSHLLKLPVDSLKIDRSFVSGIEENPRRAAIVRSLVTLAAALDLDIIAEGVETRAELNVIRSLGCHLIQGYLISRPMPAHDIPAFTSVFRPRLLLTNAA